MSVPSRVPPGRHELRVTWKNSKYNKQVPDKVFTFDVENPDYGKATVDPDVEALKKKFRGYTVAVLQQGSSCKELKLKAYAGCEDAKLHSTHKVSDRNTDNVNYGGTDRLEVGHYGQTLRTLIRFDLSMIPKKAQVQAVVLKLRTDSSPGRSGKGNAQGKFAYKVLRPWGGGIGNGSRWDKKNGQIRPGECSWQTARHADKWGRPGCDQPGVDREAESLAESTWEGRDSGKKRRPAPVSKIWIKWDLTRAAKGWIAEPETNHGLLLAVKEGKNLSYDERVGQGAMFFRSANYFDPVFRPKLIVVYRR